MSSSTYLAHVIPNTDYPKLSVALSQGVTVELNSGFISKDALGRDVLKACTQLKFRAQYYGDISGREYTQSGCMGEIL